MGNLKICEFKVFLFILTMVGRVGKEGGGGRQFWVEYKIGKNLHMKKKAISRETVFFGGERKKETLVSIALSFSILLKL